MPQHMKGGFWMILVPGAVAYLRHMDDPEPTSPVRILDLLVGRGFLDDMERDRASVLKTIRRCLRDQSVA